MRNAIVIGITLLVIGTIGTYTVSAMKSGIETRNAAFQAHLAELSR